MKGRWLPRPLLTAILTLIWVLLVDHLSVGAVLLGLLLGWGIPLFTRRLWPDEVRIRRPWVLLRLIGVVLYDILVANFHVAYLVLRGPRQLAPGFVVVPIALSSDLGISLLANTISLTPGTLSSWLSPDRRVLVVHGLDVRDPRALVDTIKWRYEAPLREIFESC